MSRALNGFDKSGPHLLSEPREVGPQQSIRQSIAFMMQHQDRPLQVSELASAANTCLSHFFAIFKQVTGFTPMDFFIRLRMQRACELLDTTDFCVKEVAASLGYDDPFYFSRVFKSVTGLAPTDYRRLDEDVRVRTTEAALPVRNGCAVMIQSIKTKTDNAPDSRSDAALHPIDRQTLVH